MSEGCACAAILKMLSIEHFCVSVLVHEIIYVHVYPFYNVEYRTLLHLYPCSLLYIFHHIKIKAEGRFRLNTNSSVDSALGSLSYVMQPM